MREAQFLSILVDLSIIDDNVKKQLTACLDLRNSCSHPHWLDLQDLRVATHIEVLIGNVFARFV